MSFPTFATLGTFVVDNYVYVQEDKSTQKDTQLGGGGFWACAGARIWLKPNTICMPVGGNSLTDLLGQLAEQLEKLDAQDEISMWVWREEQTGSSILQSEIKYDGHERRCSMHPYLQQIG
ncbi:hypothetical protein K435DRAFT_872265 [Dendrothele bispora CBS 962.96]|uniref:Uncharacterized protein n=1 Tax=Dendrothele bispora (strain CBS 962.96) TaxID=1314807 RepID=A0A4V4HCA6_DENBC|nr:hypothetical protein K435DRAFT_872265 [Dendrothele bispora CBS 962.96]